MKRPLFTTRMGFACVLGGLAAATAQAQPVLHDIYPDGSRLLQSTNLLTFGVTSPLGVNAVGITVQLTSTTLLGRTVVENLTSTAGLTIGGTATERTISLPLLPNRTLYSAKIVVADTANASATSTVTFDTLSPDLTVEAEDFDYNSGQYIDNSQPNAYAGLDAEPEIDTHVGNFAGGQAAYRPSGLNTEPAGDIPRSAYADAGLQDYDVGWNDNGNWGNYTRKFPAGVYNVFMRGANGSGGVGTATLGTVAADQTITTLGTFSVPATAWQTYSWVPLKDSTGGLARFTAEDVETFRITTGGGYNANFYAFFKVNTNQPVIANVFPDGTTLFQATNTLTFTATTASSEINPEGVTVDLSYVDLLGRSGTTTLTSGHGLTVTGATDSRSVVAQLNTNILRYSAAIYVTDANGLTSTAATGFNPTNPDFLFEAEDFDHENGQFIDNGAPGSYNGLDATEGIDAHAVALNGNLAYRPSGLNTEGNGDLPRPEFTTASLTDYDVGWNDNGNWANYTRTLPPGVYNVYLRGANGNGSAGSASLSLVTSGRGTDTQATSPLGDFSIPATGGWQTYAWVPLLDAGGNLVRVTGGGVTTLRSTSGGGFNANFYAFYKANTNVPVIQSIQPDGTRLFQATNVLTFVASSLATAINPDGIKVELTSVDAQGASLVTNITTANGLIVGGTATARTVSAPLTLNVLNYTAVITVSDATGNTANATVKFDTLEPSLTFEAEDFDYNGGQFIDHPDINAYATFDAFDGIDAHAGNFGGGQAIYRPSGLNTEVNGDAKRQNYIDAALPDYDVGWNDGGNWANYTRSYPTGRYVVYMRGANGTGAAGSATLSKVTDGVGTDAQTTELLGSFAIPATAGWQSYIWIPLKDDSGKLVVFDGGATNTLRVTTGGGYNANFYAFFPAASGGDTNAHPVTLGASLSAGNIGISFPTQAGFAYQVEYKASLTDASWIALGAAVIGDGASHAVTDPASQVQRFYRVTISVKP
ncbi:MAG TPA: carbohydrate-binding protein [Candidatus Limnocylindria bacterium]|jgi:hypothetical protein|nr:carbohydrate-binding protein [Candidatus Limnocylindria bacterium]